MKLQEALHIIRTGDVLLFRGRNLFSWLIKLRTRSVYSHAGIVMKIKTNGHQRVCVIEALEPFGVRLYPLERYLTAGEQIDWFQLNDPAIDPEKVADFAMAQWGARYSFRSLWWSFSWVAHYLQRIRRFNRLVSRRASDGTFFCSQLVASALAHAGFKPDEGLVPIETDPGAVARFTCLQRKGTLQP